MRYRGRPPTGRTTLGLTLTILGLLLTTSTTIAQATGLPDGRVFEMVTPVENRDANVYAPEAITEEMHPGEGDTTTLLPFRASVDGDAVAYAGDATVGGMGRTGAAEGDEYVARRFASGGWLQADAEPLGVNGEGVNDVTGVKSTYYQAFSSDLSVGILQSGAALESGDESEPVLTAGVPAKYGVLYAHVAGEAPSVPLFTTTPPNRSAEEFGSINVPKIYSGASGLLAFAGASAGLGAGSVGSTELLFEANDALTANAVDGGEGENNLYVSVGGRLSLVNVLPDGAAAPGATFGGPAARPTANEPDFSGVISSDGSRIFWTDLATHVLYVRENATAPDAVTIPVSAGEAQYWTASANGEYAFYTENERLWRFDVEDQAREELADAGVQAVIGVSEDGSHIYFAATEVLATNDNSEGRTAQVDQPNLYLLDNGKTTFIATLSTAGAVEDVNNVIPKLENEPPYANVGDLSPGIGNRTAEIAPKGETLVFMSNNQNVDGYTPEFNGKPLEEVYVYQAEGGTENNGELFCASCATSHKQPELANFLTEEGLGAFLPPDWSLTEQPQWMSENGGRVFFDSIEPLVPADTNGKPDVYEWERNGTGSCQEPSGCIYLLSGGTSQSASWLIGVSATGNDVFIVSRAQLTPEDHNETYNVFDARVGGVEPVLPPTCSGTGCQGVPATAPTFATPASVTFNGVGNFPAGAAETNPAAAPKTKAKPQTRAQKLTAALKACRGKPKPRRAACVRAAHKRYGALKKKKKK
jgi:hypothetical protein